MPGRVEQAVQHRSIYVPRAEGRDTLGPGVRLGLALAREHRARLTVLSPQKSGATHHPELAKQTIVTERTGHIADGGVVLVWCPRHKTMEKLHHLEESVLVLVEWIPGEMEGWAKLQQAYNIVTDEVMDAGLSDEAVAVLERISFEGYKGWTDSISARMVRSYLADLTSLGAYDRDLVLAYARQTKDESSVQRLEKIVDGFEVTTSGTPAPPRRWEL